MSTRNTSAIDAPHLLLVSDALPAAIPERRPPPLFEVHTGTAAEIMLAIFGPPQHDNHMIRWRWHLHQKRFPK